MVCLGFGDVVHVESPRFARILCIISTRSFWEPQRPQEAANVELTRKSEPFAHHQLQDGSLWAFEV